MNTPKEDFYDYMFRGDFESAKECLSKLRGKSKQRAEQYFLEKLNRKPLKQ